MLINAQAKVADVCWMPRRKQYWVSEALQKVQTHTHKIKIKIKINSQFLILRNNNWPNNGAEEQVAEDAKGEFISAIPESASKFEFIFITVPKKVPIKKKLIYLS